MQTEAGARSHSDQSARIDDAAFGAIYGSITVMGILAATDATDLNSLATAGTLFTSILAVALAKAYADLAANVLENARPATWDLIKDAWKHGQTTLIAVNLPTLAFLVSAGGLYDGETALFLAQSFTMGLLVFYGARIGFRLNGSIVSMCLGGAFTGAIGLILSVLKALFH